MMKSKQAIELEMKGIIQVITNQTDKLFSIKQFKDHINDTLRVEYIKGLEAVDKDIKPNVNIIIPSNSARQLEALYNYVEQNLQNHVDQIGNSLRQEVQRGLQNNESKKQIISRVKRVFKDKRGVLNRLKTVIRTETNRANSQGRLEAAKQVQSTGVKLKKWLDVAPYEKGRSSPFCNTKAGSNCRNCAKGKYGDPSKAIPIDKEFILRADNKTVRAQAPPFHVNCRDILRIIREEEK